MFNLASEVMSNAIRHEIENTNKYRVRIYKYLLVQDRRSEDVLFVKEL